MTEPAGIEAFYGDAIHLLRWRCNWTVRKLAKEAGVSKSAILDYEHGRIVPRPKVRRKLARGLGISPARLHRLAAALHDEACAASGGLAAEVAADLAGDFRRVLTARLAAGQAGPPPAVTAEEVRALVPDLASLGAHDLQELEDKLPRLRSWAFVKLVGEESARAASVDAGRALELASFTLHVAERVPGTDGWKCRVFAWAIVGNARRVGSDLDGAAEASACSARLREDPPEGRPELPEPWRLLDLEASLRISQRRLPEALRLLDRAEELAPRTVRAHLLCIRSIALDRMGDLEGSIAALREALAEIDEQAEPHLFCMLRFNLADCLTGVGKAAEAAEMLPALGRMQTQIGDGLNQIRMRWLEGKIDAGLGRLDEAIETLSWVRAAFAKEDVRYDEAQAGMDLARLFLTKGRPAEVKRLVRLMEPVFRAKGVHGEAQKALALFRRAVEMETATPELAGRIASYLRRAQLDPELIFEEAA